MAWTSLVLALNEWGSTPGPQKSLILTLVPAVIFLRAELICPVVAMTDNSPSFCLEPFSLSVLHPCINSKAMRIVNANTRCMSDFLLGWRREVIGKIKTFLANRVGRKVFSQLELLKGYWNSHAFFSTLFAVLDHVFRILLSYWYWVSMSNKSERGFWSLCECSFPWLKLYIYKEMDEQLWK